MMDAITTLIDLAVKEDVGPGDITTDSIISSNDTGRGVGMAKEPLVLAGLDIVRLVFQRFDKTVRFFSSHQDGGTVEKGEILFEIEGRLQALLTGERIALNFLQRLSGIATHVRSVAESLKGSSIRLTDTRKTTAGWRVLEKYAVRIGGAHNHRMGLFDGVLIKDNHIAACGSIQKAVSLVREKMSHLVKIEVEADSLEDVRHALEAGADVIMLDNMSPDQIKEALAVIQQRVLVEVSGNIEKVDLEQLKDTKIDIISLGALTHAARWVDISMTIDRIEQAL